MKLRQLSDKIFYYPHEPENDRPMLAYLKGSKFSLAIDAGYSKKHVDDFYQSLSEFDLAKPDFTAITHWHYDHTFGMPWIHGVSLAHKTTNEFLKIEKKKLVQSDYFDFLKREDPFFAREYKTDDLLHIVLSDIQFQDELVLDCGGVSAKIFYTQSPHSEDTVCIYVLEEKVLFLGDATSEDFFNNGYLDLLKLKKLMKMIENTECEYCVLSHAAPLKKAELLSYLESILKETDSTR